MIRVGDKFKHFDDDFELIGIVKLTGDLHVRNIKNGDEGFMPKKIYYQTQYEQQKQRADELESLLYTYRENSKSIPDLIEKIQASNKRADELEKRWSELVDVLKKKYEYYKVRADDESFGSIEQEKWRIAKHEMMMVLKIMTDLKRGETE